MKHVGGETKLQNISSRYAESFAATRLTSSVEPATVDKDIRTLKRLFNLAIEPRGYPPEGAIPSGASNLARRRRSQNGMSRLSNIEPSRTLRSISGGGFCWRWLTEPVSDAVRCST
jgi:hypothetical protein